MVLRINPSRSPVWRSPNEIQVGAHRIGGLSASQQRLVTLLLRGIPANSLSMAANELQVPDAEALLSQLGPTLLSDEPPMPIDRDYIEQHFAEICRVQATYAVEGSRVIAARNRAAVFVSDCATTPRLAEALTASGVGQVFSERTAPKNLAALDIAITIDQSAIRPVNHRRWLALAVPHIAIQFDSGGVFISPLLEVGKTPCLTCLQINTDEAQLAIDSQLLFSSQRFDDSVSEHFAIAIATQTALRRIDEISGFEISDFHRVGYRLNTANGSIHEFRWQFAEACLCHRGLNE